MKKISKRNISHSYSSYKTHEKSFDENTESKSDVNKNNNSLFLSNTNLNSQSLDYGDYFSENEEILRDKQTEISPKSSKVERKKVFPIIKHMRNDSELELQKVKSRQKIETVKENITSSKGIYVYIVTNFVNLSF
ncbi:uncharacterized protein LOC114936660 [Nylanderia fulva]|uniref:uncharacterized protein LOC114936660 n=1 Tax=Nylanderia fulva TaxID=613905 RepID=UPI0010FBB77F|nr:uncharacterized protein LOC114936660 [Nylanderia fulva]